ncbi:glutathione S-transferase family protein [Marinibactrum halimedae]|uniref:GST N-terminal domain-containing protein n=1 Tax=Marinibactrum halimedae TaxID=1444977 RepID=A0AA37WKT0_9GAMM|nr:glutathione S-transferase family protein [Marinibactrum halimedae]MCD9457707.1 glutathione S-transferase family protein [Marinibactrum halimedae]GLS24919.1 hypothetical protein GCM10007877_06330 [Marinibactrum halimedae]
MSITLYGSLPSPYVRRIRLLLESMEYEFKAVNVYDDATRAEFSDISPLRKLPFLTDGDKEIFDSHVISEYVRKLKGLPETTLDEHNLISALDAVTDSLIILLMAQRSGLDATPETLLFKLQLERVPVTLHWLNQQAQAGAFTEWNLATIALICMVDWVIFRELYDLTPYENLLTARAQFASKEIVKSTFPE